MRSLGAGNRRLAIDKVKPLGLMALQAQGLECVEGQHLAALARSIESADELTPMRWTHA